jgi:hypothetical protein
VVNAQTASPALQTNAEGEIITLEEFTVSTSSFKGSFAASESGTANIRVKEEVINLPYNIQTFSADFIDDFQLYDDNDFFQFVSGATSGTGSTNVRGFSPTRLYNGFPYGLSPRTINSGTTEVMKGAASAFYGRTTPGGIINKNARRPKVKQELFAKVTATTEDYLYAGVSATGPLGKDMFNNKLFYFAYFEWDRRRGSTNYAVDFQETESWFYGLSLLYMFNRSTSLSLTYEYNPQDTADSSAPNLWVPAGQSEQFYGWHGIGSFNTYGPAIGKSYQFHGFNILFEHKINSITSLRVSAQGQSKYTDKARWSGSSTYYEGPHTFSLGNYAQTEIPGVVDHINENGTLVTNGNWYYHANNVFSERYPYVEEKLNQNAALQAEIAASFKRNGVAHRFLFSFDSSFNYDENDGRITPTENRSLLPIAARFLSFDDPYWYVFDPSLVTDRSSWRTIEQLTLGSLLSYSAKFFDEKLIAMASLRYDWVHDKIHDKTPASSVNTLAGNSVSHTKSAFTYSLGATYKINGDRLVTYLNYSTGYTPQTAIDNGTKELVKPYESWGAEWGIKGANRDASAGYTLSTYLMEQQNVRFTNAYYDASYAGQGIVSQYISGGVERAYGIDADLFYKPIKPLSFRFSGGWLHSRVIKNRDNPWLVGLPRIGVADWSGSLTASYNVLSGPLKNLTIGIAGSYTGDYYDAMADYNVKTGVQTRYIHKMDALFNMRLNINYSFTWGKSRHKPSLTITNLLNHRYYYINGREARGTAAVATWSVTY